MVSPPPRRSPLRRISCQVAIGLAALGLLAPGANARPLLPADDTPPIVTVSYDGIVGAHNWYRGSSGGNLHAGYGGGVWFTTMGKAITASYAHGEVNRFYIQFGLPY